MAQYAPGPINSRQETEHAQRLLAAQSRMYTESKQIRRVRLPVTFGIAVIAVMLGLLLPEARAVCGLAGICASVLWSVLAFGPEKRRRATAVAAQEEFDCYVYQLQWKDMAIERPSSNDVAEAATRYRGNRLADWYPRTGPLPRPFDILVCQRSNLGWGTAAHRQYAAFLTAALVALLIGTGVVAYVVTDGIFVVLPLLTPAKDLFELGREHRQSADAKEGVERAVRKIWRGALADPSSLTESTCRDVQDRIMNIRQTNATVPDWFDNRRRDTYDTSMRTSTDHLIEEAVEAGVA